MPSGSAFVSVYMRKSFRFRFGFGRFEYSEGGEFIPFAVLLASEYILLQDFSPE